MYDQAAFQGSSLVGAIRWVELVLTGQVATMVAVLAIAFVGMLMLRGDVDWRRGATVIVGCFIIFSARTIADGIALNSEQPAAAWVPTPPLVVSPPSPPAPSQPYDPYAGAAAPRQKSSEDE